MKKLPCSGLGTALLILLATLWLGSALAATPTIGPARVFSDAAGARLTLAPYGAAADHSYLVMFEHFQHEWDGKVILHHFDGSTDNKKYLIKIATGKKLKPFKTFVTIVDSGHATLDHGSIVPVVEVYLPGKSDVLHLVQTDVNMPIAEKMLQLYNTQHYQATF